MQFFSNLSIAKRLYLLNFVAAIGLIILSAITIYQTTHGLKAQANSELKHLTETATTLIAGYHERAKSGKMTEAQAKTAAAAAVSNIRYEGKGYFWINDMTPRMVMHPMKPALNGKDLSAVKDPNGKELFNEFVKVVSAGGSGFVEYYWPKPGSENPVHKQSYVAGFAPWGWVIGTGIYTDVLDAEIYDRARTQIIIQLILQVLLFLISLTVTRSIRRASRKDEVGEMARAVAVFKEKAIENNRLAAEATENEKAQGEMRDKAREQRVEADRKRTEEQEPGHLSPRRPDHPAVPGF